MAILQKSILSFLDKLKKNNNRDWMMEHKKEYQSNEKILKQFYSSVEASLNITDEISKLKVFRINRDVRFSKNKAPYNVHRSVSFSRAGAHRRGGYYLRIEPGNSAMAGGFFSPEASDLFRIRKEFEIDTTEIREILNHKKFKKAFGGFNQSYQVKTAPRNFSKDDKNIDLIKLKNYFVECKFTDKEVLSEDFEKKLMDHYLLLRPLFNYMSEVLTTDLNGVSIL
ncbi:MAG: TIGR02453 family protein [Flavobacteriaceae bacterium]|nr:TIGR02453 family protein [Flavobacteriaceae bacterium]|tara:strand:+ start:19987 stop:20661 length:675 start_codon:yes stop_codon:yes gene_type:complete